MPNPVFNEDSFNKASQDFRTAQANQGTWAAPEVGTHTATVPITDGPVSSWTKAMTLNGTITASVALLVLLLISGSFGWNAASGPVTNEGVETYQFPGIALIGIIVGFVAVIVAMMKPNLAKILGPVYAIAYGFAVGAISKGYETFYDGIVVQAVLATASVFAVMLVLYRTRIIKVTDKFRRTVIIATMGVMVLYLFAFVLSLFGTTLPFLDGSNMLLSIGFSLLVCGLAAANLALDFDFIERGVNSGMPKTYEWVAALGLVVTLVWLYLEILRLISYLRN
jgi:uncharacterized YccA/Bax inhibitor family protein